ncbi:DUF1206 domain-containing protein [Wenxinia marina]|uniref:DUF1206 domain-containing protein n=1 Tax=Wenxinia marina DSM 24838 TaxID=1123501 RepID=A0A0D0NLU3_9RHOB|nr:DUF1206 domain-containing protein [Wenxinia marina]KIQ69230.1 hypothetical protein Wenmar_02301 [Wenxinia marina DSM 24838]GGL71302.1 hypothetical protein GCM10011392_27390 [Wenxinia marina]
MSEQAPGWVVPAMRAGYSARAVVYVIIGGLALAAAITGGQAPEGQSGALDQLRGWPFGTFLLWVIGIGLWLYAIWRWMCAWMDLEDRGTDGEGLIARTGQVVTGIIHAALGVTAIQLAMGNSGGSGEDSRAEHWTAEVLAMPAGRWIVGAIGLVIIGAGVFYIYKGYAEKFRRYLRATTTMEKLVPFAKVGLIAFGGVVALIGGFVLFAAIQSNAEQAGGFGDAFATIRQQAYGQVLLGIVAVGLICYAVYNVIEAGWRVVPKAADSDVITLAQKAERQAKAAAR